MARFIFTSPEAANHAYQTLQEMARTVAALTDEDHVAENMDALPAPELLDRLVTQPELMSREERAEWQRRINEQTDLSSHSLWNGFTRNAARFGDAYQTLMMYDWADGRLDGQIDFEGHVEQFSFGNLTSCDNGQQPEDASDLLQCQPANFWTQTYKGAGEASYYSTGFEGRLTASETTYRIGEYTVAHLTLPLGTVIEIQSGERTVRAVVTDRGPYANDSDGEPRVLDLSPAVFQALGHELDEGVIKVAYHVVRFGADQVYAENSQ